MIYILSIATIALLFSPAIADASNSIEAWLEILNLEEPNETVQEKIDPKPERDLFLLYTRRNRNLGEILKYGDAESVTSSNFNPNVPTVVVVHGWQQDRHSLINPTLRSALLNDDDVNVIYLDWSRYSKLGYITAVRGVPSVGRGLGLFLSFLNKTTGMPYNLVHLIGFSLGGHVVGSAGRQLNGNIARITALDPGGPLWYNNPQRLRSTDARYVEAIHTNAGGLGIKMAVGDTDFFPNGGSTQPGCIISLNVLCNHYRSYELYAATVNRHPNKLVGRQCSSVSALELGLCRGRSLPMGNTDLNKTGTGVYRLNTRAVYPY